MLMPFLTLILKGGKCPPILQLCPSSNGVFDPIMLSLFLLISLSKSTLTLFLCNHKGMVYIGVVHQPVISVTYTVAFLGAINICSKRNFRILRHFETSKMTRCQELPGASPPGPTWVLTAPPK